MRRIKRIELMDGDAPLTFEITQMSATQQYNWVLRAGLLLAASAGEAGITVDTKTDFSMAWVGKMFREHGLGLFKGLAPEKVQPLLDELLFCCSRVVDNAKYPCTRESIDGYVSNFTTIVRLQMEALSVCFGGFFTQKSTDGNGEQSPLKSSKAETTLKIPRRA